jgi:leucyl aminopeptidase
MQTSFHTSRRLTAGLKNVAADVLLVGVSGALNDHPHFGILDRHCKGALKIRATTEEFEPKAGKTLVHNLSGLSSQHVVFFGVGSASLDDVRAGLEAAFGKAKALKAKTVALAPTLSDQDDLTAIGELIGEAAATANHNLKTYKTAKSGYKAPPQFDSLTIVAEKRHQAGLEQGIAAGSHIGKAINFACDLAGEPANIMTPTAFSQLAERIGKTTQTEGTITAVSFDEQSLHSMGAQGILMVARGSAEKPWLIELVYHPKGGPTEACLTLIGKTVTFDTGGNDIKVGGGMRDMKRDKTGGANVLAAFEAIAALNVPMSVKAYFAATENMVGERAYRAGDVFTTMAGRTVEVGNTDAEGRLTLVEALEFAQKSHYEKTSNEGKPTWVVDVATLTGAAKQVGGDVAPLAFGNDAEFSALVVRAAAVAGEKIALQEMLPEVRKYNDSPIADVCNVGAAKGAGSMSAAWFIREWVWPAVKWVHMDIANVAWKNDRATGHSVRTLITLARLMSKG